MKRPGAVEKTLERVQNWRRIAPDITVRSTFIVGFPGETEAEFEELLSFLDEAQLDRVGAFAYSPVAGATANDLPDAVPEEVKQERLARFMEKQAQISAARLEAKIGTVQQCLVDGIEGDIAVARSKADAPEIDGLRTSRMPTRCRCAWANSSTWRSRATSMTCTVTLAGRPPSGVRPQGAVIAATAATGNGGGSRRFVPPPRAAVAAWRFEHPLFAGLQDFRDLLDGTAWPSIAALDARLAVPGAPG